MVPFDVAVTADSQFKNRYGRFMRQPCAAGLPMWPIGRAFEGRVFRDLIVNAGDAHPNELANRLAAEAAFASLSAALRTGAGSRQAVCCGEAVSRGEARRGNLERQF